jgi:superfamily II DNA/RNA helicase
MSFADLGLSDEVLKAVSDASYSEPTPIQAAAIPNVLMGRDILGCAQTGTGKTASFTLPMIDILASGRARARMPRTLILEPTRELAAQVAENFDIYGKYHKLTKALIIGGTSMDEQSKLLDRGVDVLIATPGRLLDIFDRGGLLLTDVKILVIDEADRMLDMGFIPDVEKIVSLLNKIRQTLLFSATMPPEIKRLADAFLMNPKEITVAPPSTPGENITQGLVMFRHTPKRDIGGMQKKKRAALRELIAKEDVTNALVFCNRKRDVDIVHKSCQKHGLNSATLHGDMSQPARMETMDRFKAREIDILVCSDVAARGLDIDDLSHVFNFDVPTHAEDYVHRIGRTGRAGKKGRAFTLAWQEEQKYLDSIEKLTGSKIDPVKLDRLGTEAENASGNESDNKSDSGEKKERRPRKRASAKSEGSKKDAAKSSDDNAKPRNSRSSRRDKKDDDNDHSDNPVVGMGDHMPAFLARPVNS